VTLVDGKLQPPDRGQTRIPRFQLLQQLAARERSRTWQGFIPGTGKFGDLGKVDQPDRIAGWRSGAGDRRVDAGGSGSARHGDGWAVPAYRRGRSGEAWRQPFPALAA